MTTRAGLEIRAATTADAPGICALLGTAGQAIAARDMASRLDALRQAPGAALIAVEWGPPSGIVVLHWYRTLNVAGPIAQITTLFVGEEHRRRGVGRLLVKAAAHAARIAECGVLELKATADHTTLSAFCLSTGFAAAGVRYVRPLRKKSIE